MPILEAQNVYHEYATRSGSLAILQGITLSLNQGDALAVLGPSGSGKSTLLHLLGTLTKPTRGTIVLQGKNPSTLSETDLAHFRNTTIGFIFQDHHLLPQCSALENVLIPTLALPALQRVGTEARARQLLEKVGLGQRLDHKPAELSGGEKQRTAVCRALIQKPAIVLADEPTGSLDRHAAESVGELLLNLCKEDNAVLVCVTHSAELAQRFPTRMELLDGQLKPMQ
ncbi:MAG: ABC transporter ATP-binding protein [Planctomycetia bacterium]|nr:ABC transporter ATP-binding protein [Planctomycetia bacterium]